MNVKELKEKIKDLPDNMDVFIEQTNTGFETSLAEQVKVTCIVFTDDELKGEEDCLLIRDY